MSRELRADAKANHERILEVAAAVFARDGSEATLKVIAAEAGVGIGTLYRRFESRNDLIEATYRHETEKLAEATPELLRRRTAVRALIVWMERFVDYMTTKHGMADALPEILGARDGLRDHSRAALVGAVQTLLEAGASDGTIRTDVSSGDVLMALGGVAMITAHESDRSLASRLIALLVEGVEPRRA
jgi:AcrR family transcriptional regulator